MSDPVHDPPEYDAAILSAEQFADVVATLWCADDVAAAALEAHDAALRSRLADTEADAKACRAIGDRYITRANAAEARVAALTEALRATTGWLDEWWADPDNPPAAPRQWRTLLSEDGSG